VVTEHGREANSMPLWINCFTSCHKNMPAFQRNFWRNGVADALTFHWFNTSEMHYAFSKGVEYIPWGSRSGYISACEKEATRRNVRKM
jgi:hypothetical protein